MLLRGSSCGTFCPRLEVGTLFCRRIMVTGARLVQLVFPRAVFGENLVRFPQISRIIADKTQNASALICAICGRYNPECFSVFSMQKPFVTFELPLVFCLHRKSYLYFSWSTIR